MLSYLPELGLLSIQFTVLISWDFWGPEMDILTEEMITELLFCQSSA